MSEMIERCAGSRVAADFDAMTANLTIIQGVRLSQVLEAVYDQGKKDTLELMQSAIADSKQLSPNGKIDRPVQRRQ